MSEVKNINFFSVLSIVFGIFALFTISFVEYWGPIINFLNINSFIISNYNTFLTIIILLSCIAPLIGLLGIGMGIIGIKRKIENKVIAVIGMTSNIVAILLFCSFLVMIIIKLMSNHAD